MIEDSIYLYKNDNRDLWNFVIAVNAIEREANMVVEMMKEKSQENVKTALTAVRKSIIHAMNTAIYLSYTDDREISNQIFYTFANNNDLVDYPRAILDNLTAGKHEAAKSIYSSLCGSELCHKINYAKLREIILKRIEAVKQPETLIRDEDNAN